MSDSGEEVPISSGEASNTIKISTKGDQTAQGRVIEPKRAVTELSFLLDLLLNHKLAPSTKGAISERIKEVEVALNNRTVSIQPTPVIQHPAVPMVSGGSFPGQSASMQAIMARHTDVLSISKQPIAEVQEVPPPPSAPVTVIAQNAATQAALAARQSLMLGAGKIEKGRTSPRKF